MKKKEMKKKMKSLKAHMKKMEMMKRTNLGMMKCLIMNHLIE